MSVFDGMSNGSLRIFEAKPAAPSGMACNKSVDYIHMLLRGDQGGFQVHIHESDRMSDCPTCVPQVRLTLSQSDKMPFGNQGFYYHDFENLPTIPEDEEEKATSPEAEKGIQDSYAPLRTPVLIASDGRGLSSLEAVQTTPRPVHDAEAASINGQQSSGAGQMPWTESLFCGYCGPWARLKKPPKTSSQSSVRNGTRLVDATAGGGACFAISNITRDKPLVTSD